MIGPIKTVTVYVDNQEKAVEFYTQKLGFVVRRSLPMGPNAQWVEVSPRGTETCLVLYPKAMMPNATAFKAGVVFHCSDVPAACRHLESLGVTIGMPPRKMPWGDVCDLP